MHRPRLWGAALVVALSIVVVLTALGGPAGAQADDELAAERELAERYAPIVVVKAQEDECDTYGEPYRPMRVDALLDNEQIALRMVGNRDPVVKWGPSAADIAELGQGFYLDFPGASLTPGCTYERDFRRFTEGMRPAVYAHVATQADEPDQLALQYWIYWYYNDWNNKHESDWEFIQIVFPASSAQEALNVEPTSVGYAQHEGGERASWRSDKLEREGDHPVVYASAGSHASYFGSALFLGRSASEGFGCDNTDGPSERLRPEVVLLPDEVEGSDDPAAWLLFAGRWGERHDGPFNGPDGPYRKDRWTKPIDWHDGLRSRSVIVPTGDAQATELVKAFCGAVEWGSVQVIALQTSPLRVVLTTAALVAIVVTFVKRTAWNVVDPVPVRRRRRAGEIVRASVALYRRHPVAFAAVGLTYLPLAALAAGVGAVAGWLPFLGDVVSASSNGGGIARSIMSTLIGGFATVAVFVVVISAIAAMVDDIAAGAAASPRHAYARVGGRFRELLAGLLRAYAIVIALLVIVVGLPWAIRQMVRYQFLPQTVVLDGDDGRRGLERSSQLVRGRWWHTLLFVGVVYGAITSSGVVVGLLLLLTLTSLPLWLISLLATIVTALLIPLGAIALTLLYGDAAAEADEHATTEVAEPDVVPSFDA